MLPSVQGGFGNDFGTTVPWTVDGSRDRSHDFRGDHQCGCGVSTCQGGCRARRDIDEADPSGVIDTDKASKGAFSFDHRMDHLTAGEGRFDARIGGNIVNSLGRSNFREPFLNDCQRAQTIASLFSRSGVPELAETNPAGNLPLLQGRIIDRILGDIEVPALVNANGDIFSDPEMTVSQRRMDQLNGFDHTVNGFSYEDCQPGSFRRGFKRDAFLIDLGDAHTHPFKDRIFQSNVRPESHRLGLYINGMPGRTIWLTRRPEPYYFIYRPLAMNPTFPCDPCSFDLEETAFYFTTDPVGGSSTSTINAGYEPPVFPLARPIYANSNVYAMCVNNEFPCQLYYQCRLAPFMGGVVRVLGRFGRA